MSYRDVPRQDRVPRGHRARRVGTLSVYRAGYTLKHFPNRGVHDSDGIFQCEDVSLSQPQTTALDLAVSREMTGTLAARSPLAGRGSNIPQMP